MCTFVVGVYFIIFTHCVIFLLHEGRSAADQCDQDIRPTSIVGKSREIVWTQRLDGVGIGNYALKTSPIAYIKPPELLPASMMMEVKYR